MTNHGSFKSVDQWQKSWADWKSSVKEKACKIHQYKNRTGGGTPPELQMTPLEQRVEKICGKYQLRGDDGIREFGFVLPKKKPKEATQFSENNNNNNNINNNNNNNSSNNSNALAPTISVNVSSSQVSQKSGSNYNANPLNARKRLFDDKENNDVVFLPDSDDGSFNLSTPPKRSMPSPSLSNSTPKTSRFASSRNQTEQALSMQKENNETLKIIASQNVKIIARLDQMIDLLQRKG